LVDVTFVAFATEIAPFLSFLGQKLLHWNLIQTIYLFLCLYTTPPALSIGVFERHSAWTTPYFYVSFQDNVDSKHKKEWRIATSLFGCLRTDRAMSCGVFILVP